MQKFIGLWDLHFGFERKGGHKVPLHDTKALNVALAFMKDFKPDHVILGGDILDCGCISHHNHGKPGATEGFKLLSDANGLRDALITPIEKITPKAKKVYIVGNHERWIADLEQQIPALEGIINVESLLKLDSTWKVVPQGEAYKLGKLMFIHGDQVKGGEHSAKWATLAYEANVRFGHFHTHAVYSKIAAFDTNGHNGIAVPCLCRRNPNYGGNSPNRWAQGFYWGYLQNDGTFSDYVTVIINGQATINGKTYVG